MINSTKTMAYNTDITYCNGKGCLLHNQCHRYLEGQRIMNSREEGQHYWMDHCDEENREAFIKTKQ